MHSVNDTEIYFKILIIKTYPSSVEATDWPTHYTVYNVNFIIKLVAGTEICNQ